MTPDYNRTFLAFDYGERRIGVAKSDPTGMIPSPLVTLEVNSQSQALAKIVALIEEYEPNGLVFGYPLLRSGDKSPKCQQIDKFIKKLTGLTELPIHRVNEYDTSNEAMAVIQAHGKKSGKNKARIDLLSAVIILQRFLEDFDETK